MLRRAAGARRGGERRPRRHASTTPRWSRRLTAGRLAAAVLDVFPEEPLPPDHVLWRTPERPHHLPHVGAELPGRHRRRLRRQLPPLRRRAAAAPRGRFRARLLRFVSEAWSSIEPNAHDFGDPNDHADRGARAGGPRRPRAGPVLRLRTACASATSTAAPVIRSLLLHGNGGSLQGWIDTGIVGNLERNYRVIALDARGHGQSGKPRDVAAYGQQMGLDMIRLMDHLRIPRAHLVGYSMGASIRREAADHASRSVPDGHDGRIDRAVQVHAGRGRAPGTRGGREGARLREPQPDDPAGPAGPAAAVGRRLQGARERRAWPIRTRTASPWRPCTAASRTWR